MFTRAIVRTPAPTLTEGITSASLGKPDYELALQQHAAYIAALEACGLAVTALAPDPAFPDSCFVEDTAVLAERVAVVTRPGAPSRQGEEAAVAEALREFYRPDQMAHITPPGTLEGGDVMRVEDHFYIGLSARTNLEGAHQLIAFLEKYEYTGSTVEMKEMLHLKTGLAYLEHNRLLTAGEFIHYPLFAYFKTLPIDPQEAYAANCIYVNGTVLVPAGYPRTLAQIEAAGLKTLAVDTSEFRKLDGGLSCLSLRF